MVIGAASLLVLPELPIFFQVIDWPGVGVTVVEIPDFLCDTK
jgi:hypothetical protein